MSKRLDISAPRKKKDGSTFWVKLGSAWINDNGQTQLVFDALPLPDAEGRCVANLFEPREDNRSGARDRQASQERAQPQYTDDESDIPFNRG